MCVYVHTQEILVIPKIVLRYVKFALYQIVEDFPKIIRKLILLILLLSSV